MKRYVWVAVLAGLIASSANGWADAAADSKPPSAMLEAAKAITKITGVAISPLLGTAAVGTYDYFTAPKEKKAKLPWYDHPYFWLPALLLVGLVAAKDMIGAALPPGAKKPLDVLETIENKVSGVVVTGAFVPFVASIFGKFTESGGNADAAHHAYYAGLAAFHFSSLLNILTIPFAMTVFVIVWLLGHVINILILVSPFGAVDAALKSLRTALMGLVAVTSFINPWIGAALSIVIIVFAYLVAGWTFRLTIFGSVYIWDFVTGRRRRFHPAADANWMFTARKIEQTPIRTYGKLARGQNGRLNLEYRRLLWFGPTKTLALPEGTYAVGRGMFYPEIMLLQPDKSKHRTMLVMPPRYRTHEDEVAKIYQLSGMQDVGLLRGLKAIWNWVRGHSEPTSQGAQPSPV